MPLTLTWQEIALRLGWTVLAGMIIGFNRSEHGRPAGMRTTLLVCLAASFSMIQANLLLHTVGRSGDSFVNLDVMRLPLGILSGMGFIGAGAILRRENVVLGVTTAATLWFTTIMGLCFGGGQIGLGVAALTLGLATLWGLKYVERALKQELRASLNITVSAEGPSDAEIRLLIASAHCKLVSWGIIYCDRGASRELHTEIERQARTDDTHPPAFVEALAKNPQVRRVEWRPQGLPRASNGEQDG